jgi:hypothetical protein
VLGGLPGVIVFDEKSRGARNGTDLTEGLNHGTCSPAGFR